jgi:N-acetylglucosamine-6-phosphate deacetylase
MPTLTARTLITAIGTVAYPVIEVDSAGIITDISSDASVRSEAILTPTFLDVHIHGAAGYDVMDCPARGLAEVQRFLARRGTGHYLPTTVTAGLDDTFRALEGLASAIERPTPGDEAMPLGIHLEGPFLSHAKRGVHLPGLLQQPSVEMFERFQQAARGHIRLVTVAPELAGALEMIAFATAQGVRASLGHSNATAAEAEAGIKAGAVSATHTFNAMRAMDHREPAIAGVVLDDEALYAELICDGIHVAPAMVRLWLRLKGERAILMTDGISATGMPDGAYVLAGVPITVADGKASVTDAPGTLAGSVLTMDRAVANLQEFTGCGLEAAVRCASSQPAAMLGVGDSIASLRVGQAANFNEFSADGRLAGTYLRGRRLV